MRRIAKFHKVSPAQFAKDWKDTFPTVDEKVPDMIFLPLLISHWPRERLQRSRLVSAWKWNRTGY